MGATTGQASTTQVSAESEVHFKAVLPPASLHTLSSGQSGRNPLGEGIPDCPRATSPCSTSEKIRNEVKSSIWIDHSQRAVCICLSQGVIFCLLLEHKSKLKILCSCLS